MEDKKFLRVTGKRVEKNGNVVAEAIAIPPPVRLHIFMTNIMTLLTEKRTQSARSRAII